MKMKVKVLHRSVYLAWVVAFILGFLLAFILEPLSVTFLVLSILIIATPLDVKLSHITKCKFFPANLKDSIITNLIEVSFIILGYLGGRFIA